MLKHFLLLTLLISHIASQCSDGCTNCSANDVCLYCDVTSKYFLDNGRCSKFTDQKCTQFDMTGKCLSCIQDTYLDLNINSCVNVTTLIPNCLLYFSEKTCLQCIQGFMVSNGVCAVVTKVISNCNTQQDDKCLSCASGYILSLAGDTCTPSPGVANCASYQTVECKQCNSQYIKNQNFYLFNIFGFQFRSQMDMLTSYLQTQQQGSVDKFKSQVCQKGQVPNCISHRTFNQCGKCDSGFFLNKDGICQSFPIQAIPNCIRYTSYSTCVQCSVGFQLTKDGVCVPVIPIDNCVLYSPTSSTSSCIKCNNGYKVLGRLCIPRKVKIDNCREYSEDRDACKTCDDGMFVTNDEQKCLRVIPQCQRYAPSNRFSTTAICDICVPGSYVDVATNTCVAGTVQNCDKYERTRNVCMICQNKFYIRDGACISQDIIFGCDNYHPFTPTVCSTCKNSSFLTRNVVRCQPVDTIMNCMIFTSKSTCYRCQDGFTLINNTCQVINPAENCLQKTRNHCTKCLKDFTNDEGVCKSPLDYIVINCEKTSVDGVNRYRQNTCSVCRENSMPWNYADSFVCTEWSYISSVASTPIDPNCLQYTMINGTLLCMKCELTFILSSSNTCVSSCPTTLYRQTLKNDVRVGNNRIDNLTVEFINFCGPKITNCAIAAPDLFQPFPNKPRYTCVKCDANTLPTIDFFSNSTSIVRTPDGAQTVAYGVSPVSFRPGLKCIEITLNGDQQVLPNPLTINGVAPVENIKRLGDFVGNSVPNCEFYSLIEPGIGCVKCNHAFAGPVLSVVNQCARYRDSYTCLECNQGFYLFRPHECKPVTPILNCARYDPMNSTVRCIQCGIDYYVNVTSGTCILRTRSRSVVNAILLNTTDDVNCTNGFVKLPANVTDTVTPFTCNQLPSNCLVPTIVNNSITGCTTCNSTTSYPLNGNCIIGTVSNCVLYSQSNPFSCQQCANRFYLSAGVCVAHNWDRNPNCVKFKNTLQNQCEICSNDSIITTPVTQCRQIVTISNCIEYSSPTQCKTCQNGYRLANLRTACNAIPASENCLVMVPQIFSILRTMADTPDADKNREFVYDCSTCFDGFYQQTRTTTVNWIDGSSTSVTQKYCVDWLNYKLENCDSHEVRNTANLMSKCLSCKPDFYPLNLDNRYVCISRNYHTSKSLVIDNCQILQWSVGTNNFICVKCNYPYVLEGTACVQQCSVSGEGYIVNNYILSGDNYQSPATLTKCAALPAGVPANCKRMANAISDGTYTSTVCIACDKDYLPTYALRKDGVRFDPLRTDKIEGPFNAFPSIDQCIDKTKVLYTRGDSNAIYQLTEITNCRFYQVLETNSTYTMVGCITCNIGFTGRIFKYTDQSSNEFGIIRECSAMPISGTGGCNTTSPLNNGFGLGISIDNLDPTGPLTLLYSCFECATSTELPAIGLMYDSTNVTTSQFEWSFDGATFRTLTPTSTRSFQTFCTAPPANIPANCATMAYNVTSLSKTTHMDSYFCTSCKPGYFPMVDTFLDGAQYTRVQARVAMCIPIQNCDTKGTWLNYCSNCVLSIDSSKDIPVVNATKCVVNATDPTFKTNCFAANDLGNCMICNKGFDLNKNGTCVQPKVPSCPVANLKNPFTDLFLSVQGANVYRAIDNPGIAEFFFNDYIGCQNCTSDQILTQLVDDTVTQRETQSTVCVSKALELPVAVTVDNCVNLNINGPQKCYTCANGFVKTTTDTCVSQNIGRNLQNCTLVKKPTINYCMNCFNTTDAVNIGGICVPKSLAIPNCKVYDDNFSKTTYQAKCLTCQDNFYPTDSSRVCTPIPASFPNCAELNSVGPDPLYSKCYRCRDNFVLITLKDNVQYCLPTAQPIMFDPFCLTYDAAGFNLASKSMTCTKCMAGYFPVNANADVGTYCSTFQMNPNPLCNTYDIPSETGLLSTVDLRCKDCKNPRLQFFDAARRDCVVRQFLDANCKTYAVNADECAECNDSYIVEPVFKRSCQKIPFVNNFNPTNKSYLQYCSAMPSCVDSIYYEGLSKIVNSLLSCHSCSTLGQIPFLIGQGGWPFQRIQGLQNYALNVNSTQRFMDGNGDSSTRCLSPTSFGVGIPAALFTFPSNCGVGFINANSVLDASNADRTTNVDRTKIATICIACAPKFAPVYANDTAAAPIQDMIGSCAPIANCESSNWFNYCSQCAPNYVYAYENGIGVRYDQCVLLDTNPNCHAVDIKSIPNKKICRFCKVGYTLNIDGNCEMIRPPRCFISNFRFRENYNVEDLSTGLILSREGTGCQRCDTGFIAIYNKEPLNLCTQSPFIASKTMTSDSNFIYKCKNYIIDKSSRLKCQKCEDGFILKTDGRCVDATTQPNCVVAFDTQFCSECNRTLSVNVDHTCQPFSIPNCVSYTNNHTYSQPVCNACNKTTFLDANTCRPNPTSLCELSDSNRTCIQCAQGYMPLRSTNLTDYCVANDPSLNCTRLDQGWLQKGKVVCRQCTNPSSLFLSSKPDSVSYCLNSQPLDNCLRYDIKSAFASSNFTCVECISTYYLTPGFTCARRLLNEPNCVQYSLLADNCTTCAPGYFLGTDFKSCIKYPDGISGCREYAYREKCSSCIENFYLSNNQCLPIPNKNLIENCLFYDDVITCKKCKPGFAVSEGKCSPATAQNCLDYQSIYACATCPTGFGLKEENGMINCVSISIDNCAITETIFPFKCITCKPKFFVRDGACIPVTKVIDSCIIYAGTDSCAQCDFGTALAPDALSCTKISTLSNQIDPNCQISEMKPQGQCIACQLGYYFNYNTCVPCKAGVGCNGCLDSNPTVCTMCGSGYYMNAFQKCVPNGQALRGLEGRDSVTPQILFYSDFKHLSSQHK